MFASRSPLKLSPSNLHAAVIAKVFFLLLTMCLPKPVAAQTSEATVTNIHRPANLTADQIAAGWIALFDGRTLFGWRAEDKTTNWRVLDGAIVVDEGKQSLLRTTTEFDDFELSIDFLANEKTNSGVFLRTSPNPKNMAADCYELNIANDANHPFPTGSLVNRKCVDVLSQNNQWRTFHVRVEGRRVTVSLDDKLINEYTDDSGLGRGYIGLQYDAGMTKFRNLRLRPLNVTPIFNGADLSQWDASQTNDSVFAVTSNNEIKAIGGRGQLESKVRHANFMFSMQCRTNADGLNSGVFFRSIPGEFTNGYESQIQNEFKNQDRAQPVDCGTGGIFRRINARSVNANDQAWFSKTIIAQGPHLSVWVNGLQVTDWSDRRKPHANPRKGLRKEAGTFILQGHDPTTDILFKNLRARELSNRR